MFNGDIMHKLIEFLEGEDNDIANLKIDDISLYFTYEDIKDMSVIELLREANNPNLIRLCSIAASHNKINA